MPSNFSGKKMKKGDYVFKTANEVMALMWKDKKDVKMLSIWHILEMVPTEKHNASGNPTIKPMWIISYNKGIRWVDHSDQILATCCSVRNIPNGIKSYFFI